MNNFCEIPLEKIHTGTRFRKDCGGLKMLVSSISQLGLLQPIVVRQENNDYILLAGFRRLQAYKMLGYSTIHAHIIGDIIK